MLCNVTHFIILKKRCWVLKKVLFTSAAPLIFLMLGGFWGFQRLLQPNHDNSNILLKIRISCLKPDLARPYATHQGNILPSLVVVVAFPGDGGSLPSGRHLQRPADQRAQVHQEAPAGGGEGPEAGAAGGPGGEAERGAGAEPPAEGGGESPGADEQPGGSSAGHPVGERPAGEPGPGQCAQRNFGWRSRGNVSVLVVGKNCRLVFSPLQTLQFDRNQLAAVTNENESLRKQVEQMEGEAKK